MVSLLMVSSFVTKDDVILDGWFDMNDAENIRYGKIVWDDEKLKNIFHKTFQSLNQ